MRLKTLLTKLFFICYFAAILLLHSQLWSTVERKASLYLMLITSLTYFDPEFGVLLQDWVPKVWSGLNWNFLIDNNGQN